MTKLNKHGIILAVCALLAPVSKASAHQRRPSRTSHPAVIDLPQGFGSEGITNRGRSLFVGSNISGDIYRVNARTGEGEVIYDAPEGRVTLGLEYEAAHDRLWAIDALAPAVSLHDPDSGELLERIELEVPEAALINDLVISNGVAYLSNSFGNGYFRIPMDEDGALLEPEYIKFSGQWTPATESIIPDFPPFGANGIDVTPDGSALLVVNLTTGLLYRVDPKTGEATLYENLAPQVGGDGIVVQGRTVYLTVNAANLIAVYRSNHDGTSLRFVKTITDDNFDSPSTSTIWNGRIYTANSRGALEDRASAAYQIVVNPLPRQRRRSRRRGRRRGGC